jgi:hypothetical protein
LVKLQFYLKSIGDSPRARFKAILSPFKALSVP